MFLKLYQEKYMDRDLCEIEKRIICKNVKMFICQAQPIAMNGTNGKNNLGCDNYLDLPRPYFVVLAQLLFHRYLQTLGFMKPLVK